MTQWGKMISPTKQLKDLDQNNKVEKNSTSTKKRKYQETKSYRETT